MTISDEIRPQTWQLRIRKTDQNVTREIEIEFKHLRITTEESLLAVLDSDPETILRPAQYPNNSDVNSSEFRSALDMSRNFFAKLNLDEAITAITRRLRDFLSTESANLFCYNLRIICLACNDLEVFPVFPVLSNLEEVYINHNHITSIPINCIKSPLCIDPTDNASYSFGSFTNNTASLVSWTVSSPKLRLIDLHNNSLESIHGLHQLLDQHQGIQHISLSSNRLTMEALSYLPSCPNLRILGLFANHIDHSPKETPVQGLTRLLNLLVSKYPLLEDLYLLGNPIITKIEYETYRSTAISIYPTLRYLDGQPNERLRAVRTVQSYTILQ